MPASSNGAGAPTPPAPRPPADDLVGLRVSIRHRRADTVARVVGELDVATESRFLVTLDQVAAACASRPTGPRVPILWCDLGGLSFLSVSGVTALDTAQRAARDRGVTLHLVACSRPVLRVLSLVGSRLVVGPDVPPDRATTGGPVPSPEETVRRRP